jgi:hypothetical protein
MVYEVLDGAIPAVLVEYVLLYTCFGSGYRADRFGVVQDRWSQIAPGISARNQCDADTSARTIEACFTVTGNGNPVACIHAAASRRSSATITLRSGQTDHSGGGNTSGEFARYIQ